MLRALLHPYWNQLSDEKRNGLPRFYFVENVDSDQIVPLFELLDPKRTLFVVQQPVQATIEPILFRDCKIHAQ